MNQREINEIRRRFRQDKNNISHIYGCYVNGNREIVSYLDTSLAFLTEEEQGLYLGLLKRSLSGTLGKNLVDIVFSTHQVIDGEEHHLLQALRQSSLTDETARNMLYQKIAETIDMGDSNYLILLASDSYDVPYRAKDGKMQEDASDTVFQYFVCAICPVRDASIGLRFVHEEQTFHSCNTGNTVAAPSVGFMFPAFDDRAANIYNALYYCRRPSEMHQEVIDSLFRVEPPMSSVEQKNAFDAALGDTLDEDCSYEVVKALHEQIRGKIEEHKESHNPEPLELSISDVGRMLSYSGISEEKVQAFQDECQQKYGNSAMLNPINIIESKKFQVNVPEVKVTVTPDYSYLVETKVIDGRKYLLIPAEEGVEINGVAVSVAGAEE